jgi:hypothetical protein
MANYLSRKVEITDIPLSSLKIGMCILCDLTLTPPPPEQVYVFTFYKGVKLAITDIPLSAFRIGIMSGSGNLPSMVNMMGIKISMSDLPDMSNLRSVAIIRYGNYGNMAIRVYFKNFSLG